MSWKTAHERAQAYAQHFSGPTGEKILEDLKRTIRWYTTSFDPNPTIAAFNEGQRSVILAITNTIRLADAPPAEEKKTTDAGDSADPSNGQSADDPEQPAYLD